MSLHSFKPVRVYLSTHENARLYMLILNILSKLSYVSVHFSFIPVYCNNLDLHNIMLYYINIFLNICCYFLLSFALVFRVSTY